MWKLYTVGYGERGAWHTLHGTCIGYYGYSSKAVAHHEISTYCFCFFLSGSSSSSLTSA